MQVMDTEVVDLGAARVRLSALPDLPRPQICSVGAYGAETTIGDVLTVNAPPATSTWRPMPHEAVLSAALQALDIGRMNVTGAEYALRDGVIVGTKSKVEGANMIALWSIGGSDSTLGVEYQRQIGIINSLDKSMGLRVSVGETVFICANLCLSGSVNLKLKHTKNLDDSLLVGMRNMVSALPGVFKLQDQRREAYAGLQLGLHESDHLMMNLYRVGALPQSKLGSLVNEYESPSAGHKPRHSLLGMREAFTATLKQYDNPFQSADRMELGIGLFDVAFAALN